MHNGHKNWDHWNVSLWLTNTPNIYRWAVYYRNKGTLDYASRQMLAYLKRRAHVLYNPKTVGDHHAPVQQGLVWGRSTRYVYTPDGARYSLSAIRAVLSSIPRGVQQ
jgi:hypothetical protein